MPGTNIAALLKTPSYEKFYELVHSYSEIIVVRAASLSMNAIILERVMLAAPANSFTDADTAYQFQEANAAFRDYARRLIEDVREFFWWPQGKDKDIEQVFRARWTPFTRPMWDKFFAEFGAFMSPRLQELGEIVYQLSSFEEFGGVYLNKQLPDVLSDVIIRTQRAYYELEFFLDMQEYDFYLADQSRYQDKFGY